MNKDKRIKEIVEAQQALVKLALATAREMVTKEPSKWTRKHDDLLVESITLPGDDYQPTGFEYQVLDNSHVAWRTWQRTRSYGLETEKDVINEWSIASPTYVAGELSTKAVELYRRIVSVTEKFEQSVENRKVSADIIADIISQGGLNFGPGKSDD